MDYNKNTHAILHTPITKEAKKELERLSKQLGMSQKAVLEVAIREKGEREWKRRQEMSK